MTEQKKGRRGFFAVFGAAAAAGVLARVSSSNPIPATQPQASAPDGDGYRLSEHVKKYYRSTTL